MRIHTAGWYRTLLAMSIALIGILELSSSQLSCIMFPGDTNHDNQIDDADLLNVLYNFGTSNPTCDFNGDGSVDDADLITLLMNFGQQGPPAFSGTRYPAQGSVRLSIQVELQGYRSQGLALPLVVEAQRVGDTAVYRQELTLFQNPDTMWISVPEPGRYRVQISAPNGMWLRAEADTNDAFKIVGLVSGQILSSEFAVRLQVPFHNYQYTDIVLTVDNQPVDWAGDIPPSPYGTPETLLTVPTDDFANGIHTLSARDIYGHLTRVEVIFQNNIFNIEVDPLFERFSGDPMIPSSCHIRATLAQPSDWEVKIFSADTSPILVKSFNGFGSTIDVVWDGLTGSGVEVEDGVYEVVFTLNGIPQQQKKRTNKNRRGEVFILLETDTSIFPGGESSWKEYLQFIKDRLRPLGPPYNNPSIIAINSREISKPSIQNSPVVKRINDHFRSRLQLFYVDSHGGNEPRPFFGIGPYTWYSTVSGSGRIRGIAYYSLRDLTRNVGYGSWTDPPALVWIDACKSAGSSLDGNIGTDDYAFATEAFMSGELGYGVFLGWNGNAVNYGAWAPPDDCWTFWRRQFWIEITSGRNFGTALSNTDTRTRNRGFGQFPLGFRPNDRRRMFGEPSSSL